MSVAILCLSFFGFIAVAFALALVGMVLYLAGLIFFKVLRGEKFVSKQPTPLTYKIPQAFGRYLERRDGWRREIPLLGQLAIFSLWPWLGISFYTGHFFNFAPFFIAFIGFGLMFCGMRLFTGSHDSSISFYHEGIANRPKGGRTPYNSYAKAVIENVNFEELTFQSITLVPKHKNWLASKDEYGFDSRDDILPLIALLKKQGLPVEQR